MLIIWVGIEVKWGSQNLKDSTSFFFVLLLNSLSCFYSIDDVFWISSYDSFFTWSGIWYVKFVPYKSPYPTFDYIYGKTL